MDTLSSGGLVRPPSDRYVWQAERRISLMKTYSQGEISRSSYLVQMGMISIKHIREANRISGDLAASKARRRNRGARTPALEARAQIALDDSLSETRPLSPRSEDSDVDQPDPFPRPEVNKRPRIAPVIEARRKGAKCAKCGKGFIWSKNLWLHCTGPCGNYFHKKCLTDDRFREPFICFVCRPDAVLAPDLGKILYV